MSGDTDTSDRDAGHPHGSTVLFGALVSTIVTASVIIALQGYFDQVKRVEEREKIINTTYEETDAYFAAEQRKLESVDWIDSETGTVRIPLERGINDYLDESAKGGR